MKKIKAGAAGLILLGLGVGWAGVAGAQSPSPAAFQNAARSWGSDVVSYMDTHHVSVHSAMAAVRHDLRTGYRANAGRLSRDIVFSSATMKDCIIVNYPVYAMVPWVDMGSTTC